MTAKCLLGDSLPMLSELYLGASSVVNAPLRVGPHTRPVATHERQQRSLGVGWEVVTSVRNEDVPRT